MVSADPALIDARGRTGESAILTAVYHRQKEIVNLLVARGATMTVFEACAAGEVERVERLIASDRSAINGFSADGWTPLHLAAFFGQYVRDWNGIMALSTLASLPLVVIFVLLQRWVVEGIGSGAIK